MTINLIRSDSLYAGVPYAYASIAAPGALIFTAGACPLDDNGNVVGVGDVRAQASLTLANLGTALAASGATFADVLKTTVFVASTQRATSPGEFGMMRRCWELWPGCAVTRSSRCWARTWTPAR